MVPYVGAPKLKAQRLVLAIRYHSQIGNPGFYIGVEALFNQTGVHEARIEFQLPPNRVVVSLQGTLAYKSNCFAEALASFRVDGKQYPMIVKSGPAGGNVNIFIRYDVPLDYAQGNAELVLGNGQVCDTSMDARKRTTWELQGLLQVY